MITTLKEMLSVKTPPVLYVSVALAMCLQQGTIPWVTDRVLRYNRDG